MPTLTVPPLTLRTVKGLPLTHGEHDENLTILSDFGNALADSISTSLNPDGTIKTGSVSADSLAERVVSQKHLATDWAPFAVDTGTSNAIRVAYTPAITSYDDDLVLFVRVASDNTGEVTINVNGLGSKALLKNGSETLSAGDIQGGSVICVAYHSGSFHLVSGLSGGSGTGESTTTTVAFEQALALPGNGLNAVFAHGLGAVPENYSVYLLCRVSELGYGVGAEVPIGTFTEVGLAPAFSVTASSSNITVSQLTANVYAPDLSNGGASTGITEASWEILVRVRTEVSTSGTMQPPQAIQVVNPDGVISYGKDLFIIARNGAAIQRLDTKTGAVQFVQSLTSGNYNNFGQFISGSVPKAFFFNDRGIFSFRLDSPGAVSIEPELSAVQNLSHFKPQELSEDASDGGSAANPAIWSVSEYPYFMSAVVMRKHVTATQVTTPHGATINLYQTLTGAINGSEFAKFETTSATYVHLFQWNPIKKRLYLICQNGNNSAGFLHIFQIATAKLRDWWLNGSRSAQTTYLKTLAIPGNGDAWAGDGYRSRTVVEFDLVTGQERAICSSHPAANGHMGTVTRAPWFEA